MPCLLAVLALAVPRVVTVVLWLFTSWFRGVFDGLLFPVLGFFFVPTTLLWYSAVHNWFDGRWGPWQIAGLVVAVLIDVSPAKKK
jgi:hypothetical protein